MTAKPKPVVIRAGDRVRVVDPRWVLRVGYPKTAADYLAATCERHEAALREIYGYKATRPTLAATLAVDFPGYKPPSAEERVSKMPPPLRRALWDLAYLACERDGFGGKERRVHLSAPMPDWEGAEFEVASVRSAMEGDYFPPYYGRNYWGESDNEPGGLTNPRVRRLASMGQGLAGVPWERIVNLSARRIEFPVEHLALVSRKGAQP